MARRRSGAEPSSPLAIGGPAVTAAAAVPAGTRLIRSALLPGAGAAAIPYMAGSDAETRTVASADVTTSLRPGRPRTGFTSR